MRVLVIGGCGFIGSHIVDHFLHAGHSVRVFSRYPEKFRIPLEEAEYFFGDFRDPIATIEALTNIDVVVHLVSSTFPGTADLDPLSDVRDNILPTLSLMELMVKLDIPRLIYLSSGGTVYGIPELIPTPESHPLRPINSYGIVKSTIEHYIKLFYRTRGILPVVVRASNPYGPRQGHTGVQGVIATLLKRVGRGEQIEIWGDGSVVRDYLYVEDLAKFCILAAASEKVGVFNCGSGQGTSLNEVIVEIRRVTGIDLQPDYKPARNIDVPCSVLDIERARTEFSWQPTVELTQGIQRTWDWLRTAQAD